MALQKIMECAISGQESQSIDQFKTFVPQRTILAQARTAKRSFVHQMQSQAGSQGSVGVNGRPSSQQIPRSQTQMLRNQQPQAQMAIGHLIGQSLANLSLQSGGVGLFQSLAFSGALHRHGE